MPPVCRPSWIGWPTGHKYGSLTHPTCAILEIGNNITNHAFSIAANPVSHADVVEDFGILVDESLAFSSHICHIVTLAFTGANLTQKCFVSKHTPSIYYLCTSAIGVRIAGVESTSH